MKAFNDATMRAMIRQHGVFRRDRRRLAFNDRLLGFPAGKPEVVLHRQALLSGEPIGNGLIGGVGQEADEEGRKEIQKF